MKNKMMLLSVMLAIAVWGGNPMADLVTAKMNTALSPLTTTNCTSIRYYVGTNEVAITNINYGDLVMALVDIAATNFPAEPNKTVNQNVVGYITFTILEKNTPPVAGGVSQ